MTTIQHNGGDAKMVTFRCPTKLWERVKVEAIRRRTSIQKMCIEALTAYLAAGKNS